MYDISRLTVNEFELKTLNLLVEIKIKEVYLHLIEQAVSL
jgi:hypothetical protein